MAQFTRSLRKRRSFFFRKARLSCATTCPGDKNRHSQEFMSRASGWTSLEYGKRGIEVSGRAPAEPFGKTRSENISHSNGKFSPRGDRCYRRGEKKIMRLIKKRASVAPSSMYHGSNARNISARTSKIFSTNGVTPSQFEHLFRDFIALSYLIRINFYIFYKLFAIFYDGKKVNYIKNK